LLGKEILWSSVVHFVSAKFTGKAAENNVFMYIVNVQCTVQLNELTNMYGTEPVLIRKARIQ
jgi:hypothetical protein